MQENENDLNNQKQSKVTQILKLIFLFGLGYFAFLLISKKMVYSFLHNLNLPIHEAGHMIFMPFGDLLSAFGGTFTQIMFPAAFVIYFLIRKDFFASGILCVWVGDSMVGAADYISDAREQALELIGGNHDWAFILGQLHLLNYDRMIGGFVFFMASLIMIAGLILAFYTLNKEAGFIKIK